MANSTTPTPLKVEECEELDDKKRDCFFVLHTRPLNIGFCSGVIKPANDFLRELETVLSGKKQNRVHLDNWILVAHFKEGDLIFSFEACENEAGSIEVYRTSGAPEASEGEKIELLTIKASPKQLLTLAQKHSYNGSKYSAVCKNSQEWVKEFARMISYELYDCLEKINTFREAGGIIATAATVPAEIIVSGFKKITAGRK